MTSSVLVLSGHEKDLGGGFTVSRVLPSAQRQSVGPFLFFDHMGPVTETPGREHDVRPHPHIGLATVTYLFEGAQMHRDSVGSLQRIEPGAVNWMTAGRGIVHSERKPDDLVDASYGVHGLQLWAALPRAQEEVAPSFAHTPANAIPEITADGHSVRVLIGEAFGVKSPVQVYMPTLYLDVKLPEGGIFELPPLYEERAVYAVDQPLLLDCPDGAQVEVGQRQMAVLPNQDVDAGGGSVRIKAGERPSRFVVIGGAPLDGHRHMYWNFVSTRKERIVQACADWEAQRMGQVPGETEFIPLPLRKFNPA
ncbi:pirin family protein [Hylemonella gracilis]|uniref:Pirin family protein n=1 Tax=Hylemonella gracilis TaxID=80880 RepID=A0A4P6UKQ6_9BURK|nr:pirin family protein [Hylemonella gracilis]QBK05693.1 pirin family protein [Hylemonella gracilis]